jgi:hypothetical protein
LSKLKPYKFSKLISILKKYDDRFVVFPRKGKGSHQMLYHPDINGRAVSFPLVVHGKNPEIGKYYIGDLKRTSELPDDLL